MRRKRGNLDYSHVILEVVEALGEVQRLLAAKMPQRDTQELEAAKVQLQALAMEPPSGEGWRDFEMDLVFAARELDDSLDQLHAAMPDLRRVARVFEQVNAFRNAALRCSLAGDPTTKP